MFGSAIMREMGNYEVFEKIIANTSTNEQSYLQKITAVFRYDSLNIICLLFDWNIMC